MLDALVAAGRRHAAVIVGVAVATSLYVVAFTEPWKTRARRLPEPDQIQTRYVPLAGAPLAFAIEDGDCVPFLSSIVARPKWQLQIADGASGCMGDNLLASYTVNSDGSVTWHQPNMPERVLFLEPSELATIRSLDRYSCKRGDTELGFHAGWFRIGVTRDVMVDGGAEIPDDSELARALHPIFEAAQARYRAKVLAGGPITARFETRHRGKLYRATVEDRVLTVIRAGKLHEQRELDDSELVDLLDDARSIMRLPLDPELVVARGEVAQGDQRFVVELGWSERGGLAIASYLTPP